MSGVPDVIINQEKRFLDQNAKRRKRLSRWFYFLCVAIAMFSVVILIILLASIWSQGHSRLSTDLLTRPHSELEIERSGMWPAILGSLFVCGVSALVALPLGVGTAIYLEEFKPAGKGLRRLHGFVQLNIANLAGVPSIVYGLLGLTVFVYMFNLFGQIRVNESAGLEIMGYRNVYQVLTLEPGHVIFVPQSDPTVRQTKFENPFQALDVDGNFYDIAIWTPGTPKPTDPAVRRATVRAGAIGGTITERKWYYLRLPFHKSFLSGGLTLALVILPIIIIASQEALRGVPSSLREASMGLGATSWQTVRNVCLPAALPGILTGAILAMGRAIGEAAPILMVMGAAVAKSSGPQHLMDDAVTMPVLIYDWAGRQQDAFKELSAAAIIVLLALLLILNSTAIFIRQKVQKAQT